VNFTLTAQDLAFVNRAGKWVTKPGAFNLMIGDLKTTVNYQE